MYIYGVKEKGRKTDICYVFKNSKLLFEHIKRLISDQLPGKNEPGLHTTNCTSTLAVH